MNDKTEKGAMKNAASTILLLLSLTACSSTPQSPAAMTHLTDADFRKMEQEVLHKINMARMHPEQYLEELKQWRSYYRADGKLLLPGNPYPMPTKEGFVAIDEAIRDVSSQKPVSPLAASSGLDKAAHDHVADQGANGETGHDGSDDSSPFDRMERYGKPSGWQGENVSYGAETAHRVVLSLMIDDGVPSRGHRENIMNPEFHVVGIACGTHRKWGSMCVLDFAGGFN